MCREHSCSYYSSAYQGFRLVAESHIDIHGAGLVVRPNLIDRGSCHAEEIQCLAAFIIKRAKNDAV